MGYLRILGGSKEAAKELKLFGLRDFLTERFRGLWDGVYAENLHLAKRRFVAGAFLTILSSSGYYGAYVFVLWTARYAGELRLGSTVFLTGSILQDIEQHPEHIRHARKHRRPGAISYGPACFFQHEADRAFREPNALPVAAPHSIRFEFRNVSFWYPGTDRRILDRLNLKIGTG